MAKSAAAVSFPDDESLSLLSKRAYIPSGETREPLLARITRMLTRVFGSRNERLIRSLLPAVEEVNARERDLWGLPDRGLRERAEEIRRRLRSGTPLDEALPEAFALVKNACRRLAGQRWSRAGEPITWEIVPFDVQLLGGIVLHQGKISEMATGEGKTLVAVFPAVLNALGGANVHIVTVNDFLARRDREWMGPIYEMLGVSVGAIQADMETEERKRQYAGDVTYGTNSEFGFDYLRDNMKPDRSLQVQRGREFAIVDEVDSILIDEARTPLIIAGPTEETAEKYQIADQVARRIKIGEDFEVHEKEMTVVLTEDGIEKAQRMVGVDSFYVGTNMDWPHFIDQALRAHYLYKRDKDYVVVQGKVIIVDEFTGRLMAGRRWSDGLHQAIEAKERVPIEEETQTYATVTIQNYFRMYRKLAGMTGTAMTEAAEFDKIYKLDVVSVPTNRPLRRVAYQDVIYRTFAEKLDAIEEEILMMHRTGRPILCGTISIEKSEVLSERLHRRGIAHEVLNAKHHAREAAIIALAGQLGRVTIATNMAGRGTDIMLGGISRADLVEHWRRWGLAPRDLKADRPEAEIEDRLLDHWMRCFLPDEAGKTPPEARRERLEEFWRSIGHPALRFVESVAALGGLHIVGTERHEARRIDNQLRGRAARQGDPGSARFYLSLEDDFLRIFASEKVSNILKRIGMTEGQPIESPMVSRQIERAQRRVEERNFEIRKNLLEYDEVMDEQRKIIYGKRQQVLNFGRIRRLDPARVASRLRELAAQGLRGGALAAAFPGELDRIWTEAELAGQLLPVPPPPAPGGVAAGTDAILAALRGSWAGRPVPDEVSGAVRRTLEKEVPPAHIAPLAEALREAGGEPAELPALLDALEQNDLRGIVWAWIEDRTDKAVDEALRTKGGEPDPAALERWAASKFGLPGIGAAVNPRDPDATKERIRSVLRGTYDERERALGSDTMRSVERFLLLNAIDTRWKEHLLNMDYLRSGIGLRAMGQRDPKVEYKKEGFELFDQMIESIKEMVTDAIFRIRLEGKEEAAVFHEDKFRYDAAPTVQAAAADAQAAAAEGSVEKIRPIKAEKRTGRNEPCPCGSGKKYKRCHGPRDAEADRARDREERERERGERRRGEGAGDGRPEGPPPAPEGPPPGAGEEDAEEPSPEAFLDDDEDEDEDGPPLPRGGRRP